MLGVNFFEINIWAGLCIPMVVSTAGLASSFCLHSLAQNFIKDQKGTESELESLRKETKKQKEHLEELRQNKTNNKDIKDKDDFSFSKVNDIKILKALRTYLNFYYDLGYNEKKYLKYYQKGILQEKLGKHYNHSDLISQWAQEYFETKNDKEKTIEEPSVNNIKVKRRK